MRAPRRVIVGAVLGTLCVGAPALRAQPAGEGDQPPGPAQKAPDKAAARAHFERARKLHDSGQYREAATAYLEAYQHFAAPAFLYNVGQVYRLAGDHELALVHYRRYLELAPNGEAAADARQFISELEARKPSEPPDPPVIEPDPKDDPSVATSESNGAAELDPGTPVVIEPQPPAVDPSAGSNLRIAGLIVAGVGVASLAVGAGFASRANSIDNTLDGHTGPWTDELDDEYRDGERADRYATISFVAGGAALATGAILYWVGRRRGLERRQPVVSVAPTGHGAAAWLTVSY